MNHTAPRVARVERTYAAPATAVFDAWTNPAVIARFWHAGDDAWRNTGAEADPRVGGRVHIAMRDPDGNTYAGGGEYTEIERPARLAFTWRWDDDPPGEQSRVELEFRERDGATTVTLTHTGLPDTASADDHASGWAAVLRHLTRVVEA